MRQTKAEIYLHLVWGTKHRQPWITPELERAVYRCIEKEVLRLKCQLLAIGGIADHVHLLVKTPTTLAVAKLANQVKGISSHMVHDQFPGNEAFDWQDGYGVFSVGVNQVPPVRDYVLNQKEHHANGPIYPRWEETDEAYIPKSSTQSDPLS